MMAIVFSRLGLDKAALNGTVIRRVTVLEEEKTPVASKAGAVWHTAARFAGNMFVISDTADARDVAHECGHAVANHGARLALTKYNEEVERSNATIAPLTEAGKAYEVASGKRVAAMEAQNKVADAINAAIKAKKSTEALDKQFAECEEVTKACLVKEADLQEKHAARKLEREAAVAALDKARRERERAEKSGTTSRVANFVAYVSKHEIARNTKYAESEWPGKPEEFYAEAYADWVMNQKALGDHSMLLLNWFKEGRYRNDVPPG
jgi:uncharacterized glyoxalase superfamily protein PhnB